MTFHTKLQNRCALDIMKYMDLLKLIIKLDT